MARKSTGRRKATTSRKGKTKRGPVSRLLRCIGIVVAICACVSVLVVVLLRFVPVYVTPLMVIRAAENPSAANERRWRHEWVPIEAVSANLLLAVIASEDQKFFVHSGFDFDSIRSSLQEYLQSENGRGRLRGGSTISQQTAKNVFLWPARSWLRKGLEVYFTILIELFWSKERILEVYLNSIEMGRGVYGAEAASRYYFQKSASQLTRRQAAAIAAALPNPRQYRINPASSYIRGRIDWIVAQMTQISLPLKR